jgi:glutathione synthase/RimK-type ligase-like ATP-grasp enzyme
MNMTDKKLKSCAILTMNNLDDFEAYDNLIEQPLIDLGWKMQMVSWRDENVNWNDYTAVIIRSPWDYQDDAPAFLDVLNNIEQSSAHLENSLTTVKWNIDKKYLRELESNGVNIVKTLWRENLTFQHVGEYFDELNVDQLVIKPRISANADNTFWLTKENYQTFYPQLEKAFSTSEFLVQPFMESVIKEGEFSLFYFNGQYSHAILKTPKDSDFRVQEEHGGRLAAITPEKNLTEHAERALSAIKMQIGMPLYARVDFVRCEQGFALMEAELIEPSLYFNMDEQSATRFAQAFVNRMQSLTL